MPLIFRELSGSLISQLVVNFNLIARHLDIFLHNAHFLLLFGSLEAELVLILSTLRVDALGDLRLLDRSRRLARCNLLLILLKLIQHLVRLQINLVLLVELDIEADHARNGAQNAGVQE